MLSVSRLGLVRCFRAHTVWASVLLVSKIGRWRLAISAFFTYFSRPKSGLFLYDTPFNSRKCRNHRLVQSMWKPLALVLHYEDLTIVAVITSAGDKRRRNERCIIASTLQFRFSPIFFLLSDSPSKLLSAIARLLATAHVLECWPVAISTEMSMSIVPMLFGGYSGALGMRRSISIVPPGPPVYFFVDRFRLLLPDAGALLCLVCDNTCRPLCTMVDLALGWLMSNMG